MNSSWRFVVLLSLLALAAVSLAANSAAMLPAAVAIHPSEYFHGIELEPRQPQVNLQLELGDTLESAVIEVVPHANDDRSVVVQFQVENSLTIMDDGPHVDLVDWKHHTSDWIDLERIDALKFRMPKLESDYELVSHFPAYTVDELYAAALAAGGQRWADIAREWPNREDGRVGVGISAVRIRVVAGEAGRAETVFTLQFSVPMGC